MDGFMRVLNYNPLDGGELNRYVKLNKGIKPVSYDRDDERI